MGSDLGVCEEEEEQGRNGCAPYRVCVWEGNKIAASGGVRCRSIDSLLTSQSHPTPLLSLSEPHLHPSLSEPHLHPPPQPDVLRRPVRCPAVRLLRLRRRVVAPGLLRLVLRRRLRRVREGLRAVVLPRLLL